MLSCTFPPPPAFWDTDPPSLMTEWGETFPSIYPDNISHQFPFCSEFVVVKCLWNQCSIVYKSLHKLIPPGTDQKMRQGLCITSNTQGIAASRQQCWHQTLLKPPALSWLTLLRGPSDGPRSVTSLCKSRVLFPYTCQNWAWGFTIWCTRSPQSIRSATGFRLKNFNLHRNSCPPQWRELPCVVRADRQQQGCRWHFVKRMAQHRVHGMDSRLSK